MRNIPNLNERYRQGRQRPQAPGTPRTPPPPNGGSQSGRGWILVFLVVGCIVLFYIFSLASNTSPGATATARAQATAAAQVRATATAGARKTATAEARQDSEAQTGSVNNDKAAIAEAKTATAAARAVATAEAKTATAVARQDAEAQNQADVASANQTATARARQADESAIVNVVRRYGEEIKVENTTYLDASSLDDVLVDPVLERQERSTCWLRNEGLYYTYDNRRFTIDSIEFHNDRQATVLAQIREDRVLHNEDGSVYKDYGREDYRAIYQLKKMSNGKWYIHCFQALEDNASTRCRVTLEGDDPCK